MKTRLGLVAVWSGGLAAIAGTLLFIAVSTLPTRGWHLLGDLVVSAPYGRLAGFGLMILLAGLVAYTLAGLVFVWRRLRGQAQHGARRAFVLGGSLCAVGLAGPIAGPNLIKFDAQPRDYKCAPLLGPELERARREAFSVGEHEFVRDSLALKVVRQLVQGREVVTVWCRIATQCGPTLSISSGERRSLNGEEIPAGAIQRQPPLGPLSSCVGWSAPEPKTPLDQRRPP